MHRRHLSGKVVPDQSDAGRGRREERGKLPAERILNIQAYQVLHKHIKSYVAFSFYYHHRTVYCLLPFLLKSPFAFSWKLFLE